VSIADRWILPDGVDEVLPPQAEKLEKVRRQLLDLFQQWGYELVIPPMIEFLESLLTGTGTDLDLKTFKVTDQMSGRLMGIRADMTPQVARIDAHSLNKPGTVRLCYAGTVLHALADNMLASRTPISVGAELFGDTNNAGDLEIVSMMIEAVIRTTGSSPHIELGDVGIFRQLVQAAEVSVENEELLFDLIQRKALPDLTASVEALNMPKQIARLIVGLPGLCGGADVLDKGRELFVDFDAIIAKLNNLAAVAEGIRQRFSSVDIYYDLSELRGYNYHTGIVFAAYLQSAGRRVAKGGRYDDVGEVFGRARGATGFDIDLKSLTSLVEVPLSTAKKVCVPAKGKNIDNRWAKICQLREDGYIVIEGSAGDCQYELREQDNQWVLVEA